MMTRRFRSFVVALIAVLAVGGCASQEVDPASTPSPTSTATPSPTPTPTPTVTPTPSVAAASVAKATTKAKATAKVSGWDKNGNGVCDPAEVLPPAPADGRWSDASEHGCQYDFDLQDRPEVAKEYAQTQREYERSVAEQQAKADGTWNYKANRPKTSGEIQWEYAVANGYACDSQPGTTYDPASDRCVAD